MLLISYNLYLKFLMYKGSLFLSHITFKIKCNDSFSQDCVDYEIFSCDEKFL